MMPWSPRLARTTLPALLAAITIAPIAALTASCSQVLGLDQFYDCPGDDRCPTCNDGLKNGDETGVDCGGPTCPGKCATGQGCATGADCTNGVCEGGKCQAPPEPTCDDGIKNGEEGDVDCGGTCPKRCGTGKGCASGADCESQVCAGGSCSAPLCTDTKKNGDETDVDCGGSCPQKCADGKGCAGPSDCASGLCDAGKCLPGSCSDTVKNGDETDVNCGGSCPQRCADGKGCGGDGDCLSQVCASGACSAPTCTDTKKNGDESDADCGGASCPKCKVGGGCALGADCETGVCQAGKCGEFYVWAKQFGDSLDQRGDVVAVDTLGSAYLFGSLLGTVDFGGGTLTGLSTSKGTITAAKFDSTGAHMWSKVLAIGTVAGAATDQYGGVTITGTTTLVGANFGGGPLATGPMYIARYTTSGAHGYSKGFAAHGRAVASLPSGDYFVAADSASGAIDFGCGSMGATGGADVLVVKFRNLGNTCAWSKRFGSGVGNDAQASAIAVDPSGNVVVGGTFTGNFDFGCGALTSATGSSSFLAKLDSTGTCAWSRAFGDPANSTTSEVKLTWMGADAAGDVLVSGYYRGAFDFGTGATPAFGSYDAWVGKVGGSSGTTSWFRHFGTAPAGSSQGGYDLSFAGTLTSAGDVVITGMGGEGVDFGGGPLNGTAAFVAKFSGAGSHIWSHGFGTLDLADGRGIAAFGAHDVTLTGTFSGQIDFGGGPKTSVGFGDIFLAKLALP